MTVEGVEDRGEHFDRASHRAACAGGVLEHQPEPVVRELQELAKRWDRPLQALGDARAEVRAEVEDDALGSNRDRHATLEAGQIGAGMATFLAHPAFQGLPAILETAGEKGYAEELRLMGALYAKGRRRRPKRRS